MEFLKQRLELAPTVSEDWTAGCALRLMTSVKGVDDMPAEGRNLVVVAACYDSLWFRIFDGDGKLAVDFVAWNQPGVGAFKARLSQLWPPHDLTRAEKDEA